MVESNRPVICSSLEINNDEQMFVSNRPAICSSAQNYATKLRTLQAAIDHYRTLYLAERRTKFKLKAENVRLTSEISKYRRKVESLEKIVAKTK